MFWLINLHASAPPGDSVRPGVLLLLLPPPGTAVYTAEGVYEPEDSGGF
jgi:hypothetical protein